MTAVQRLLLLVLFSISLNVIANNAYEEAVKSFHKKEYNETIIHLKNALKDDLEHIPSRILLVETFIAQGKGEVAETELYDLQARGVDFNQIIGLLAQSLILQNKYEQVLELATPGYRGNQIESLILFSRGQAHLGLNQLHQAEKDFTNTLALEPDFQRATLGIAQIALNQSEFSKANDYIDKALESYEPLINAWIMKSTLLQMQNRKLEALTIIDKAISLHPEHLQARLNRATLLISQEKWKDAAIDLDVILNKIPQEPRAKYLRAIVSAKSGDSSDSKKRLTEVIVTLNAIPDSVMKENPSYLFLAAITNFNSGNYEDARHYFQSYLNIKENDFNCLRYIAIIELRQGNPESAKNTLSKASMLYPNNPALLTLLGISLMELGQVEKAKFYFEEVVNLTPEHSNALSNLAQSEIVAGNYSQAIDNLLNAKQGDAKNVSISLLLVEAYLKTQQFDKASALTATLIKLQPNNSYFFKQHGIAIGLSGDIQNAKAAFKRAIELQPTNSEAIIRLARMELAEQGSQQAISLLENSIKNQPSNIHLIIELADIHLLNGDADKALNLYQQAYDLDSQNEFALMKVVDYYFTTNNHAKAEPILLAYLQKSPNKASVRIKLGRLYTQVNQPLKAIDAFTAAAPESVDRTKTYMLLAQTYLRIDNREAAIKSLNKAMAWDENRLEPLMMLYPIVLSMKDYVRAEQVIYGINKLTPERDIADIYSAQLSEMRKDYAKAEMFYLKALQKSTSRKATLGLFNVLNQQAKYEQSQLLIKKWLINNPQDVLAEISLAESYANQGKLTKSLASYQSLIDKHHRMPILLNNAANIALKVDDMPLALSLAEEAYKKAPSIASIIDTLAWIKSKQGQRSEAITLFREALVLDFDNAEIKYHLAVTLKEEQRNQEAYKLLTEAVKAKQEFADINIAKQLLVQWKNEKKRETN